MTIVTAFISDRADMYLPACRSAFPKYIRGVDSHPESTTVIDDREHELGLAGAVRAAWEWAIDQDCDYLLHWEEDFLPTGQVDMAVLAAILDTYPHLAEVTLVRQPWSPEEVAAGGIIAMDPAAYTQRCGDQYSFIEHRRLFSLNPSLIPRRVLEMGWPDDNEAGFTRLCLDKGLSFAYYGRVGDKPRVEHVGAVRAPGWKL